jgi:hypothetical protein
MILSSAVEGPVMARAVLAVALVTLGPAVAGAQTADRPYYGPYSVYGPGLSYTQRPGYTGPLASRPFATTTLGIQTSVSVPDGGTALLGGFRSFREGRNEFGTPVLGKVPYLGPPFRGTGYGYAIQSSTATIRARVIDLAEMDARILQSGR